MQDTQVFYPQNTFSVQANLTREKYDALLAKASADYEGFWMGLAATAITWQKQFTQGLNASAPPFYKWFEDGLLNVSYNCLDRHLKKHANKTAIIFEADDGSTTKVTYLELYKKVCRFANGLKSIGVTKGDRVVIYLPNSIEAIVAMQACARIGAIHSVVFGGFSAQALSDRILDAEAQIVITANTASRGGKVIHYKQVVDEALKLLGANSTLVRHTIVNKRSDAACAWLDQRDIWWNDLIAKQLESCEPTWVESEHPLFILYTSGSTGKPKGVQHSSAGYLLGAILTMQWVFDIKDNDVFWCTADVGWITGHTYVCYGPLATGSTQIIFEGVPTYPDAGRFWQIIEKYKATIFYTAPTAIRALIKVGADLPDQFDLSSLRLLGTVGEPINPEVWRWYYEVIGKSKCPIVDTWWQTETGCNMLAPIPGVTPLKPGSCTFALPGIMADIVDEQGNSVKRGEHGYLVIKQPFPSQIRSIWNLPEKFVQVYFPQDIARGKYYVAGDSARYDLDGYFWILGRIDDVINVSGHRLSTAEVESALVIHHAVAEAAVIGRSHAVKGESVCAFVVCKNNSGITPDVIESVKIELKRQVDSEIGALARPDDIYFLENLPKTRSGKIMRRLLRAIANGDHITSDTSTLENPTILDQIQRVVQRS